LSSGEKMAGRYRPVAVVTGASSGIGAATVVALGRLGYQIAAGARRVDLVRRVVGESGLSLPLDVTRLDSIEEFVAAVKKNFGRIDVLVNNAGLARGLTPVAEGSDQDWMEMWEANVLGLLRMTRAALPLIRKARHGHIVNLGSIAGIEVYKGGAGYTATKHAVHAISRTLRLELNGEPIRITEIMPGMVETEFSVVRFHGDRDAAKNVYKGVKPLVAADIADCIAFAVTRPPHVDIDEMVVRPVAQAASYLVARKP
jgi:3-hydroxy acid dehydrogenase/malonic semialdehyde reductase